LTQSAYSIAIMSPETKARSIAALKLAAVASIIGAAAGGGAIVFWMAVTEIQALLFGAGPKNLHSVASNLPWWQLLLWPTAGGLLIGLFIHRFMLEQRPRGVADVIEAAALRGGHLSQRNGFAARVRRCTGKCRIDWLWCLGRTRRAHHSSGRDSEFLDCTQGIHSTGADPPTHWLWGRSRNRCII